MPKLQLWVGSILVAAVAIAATACHDYHFRERDYKGQIDIYDDLFAVSVPEADHVVATGYWGAIYVTRDGGKTWRKADSGTQKLIYDVSMADDQVGWAVGQLGLILRTEDGGETWKPQANSKQAEGVNLLSVVALDGSRAWATGDWGTRLHTADGGQLAAGPARGYRSSSAGSPTHGRVDAPDVWP